MNALCLPDAEFRALAARVAAIVADFYAELIDMPAYPQTTGRETRLAFDEPLAEVGLGGAALDGMARVVALSRAPSARFFGYVLGSGEPVAALGDWLASALNQNVTAWRSAPAAAAIELQVVRWIAEAIGCAGFTGSLCGGGSAANLMALAMARETRLPANETGATPGTVYVSSEAHMSVAKAVALLGLGRRNLCVVPVDAQLRMSPMELDRCIATERAAGRTSVAVVASAGTVSTGAMRPSRGDCLDLSHAGCLAARRWRVWGAGRPCKAGQFPRPKLGQLALDRFAQMALPARGLRDAAHE